MAELAIIGGTGLNSLKTLEITKREMIQTPFGAPSSPLVFGNVYNTPVVFLARHGSGHTIPPHKINYRANLWALKSIGVKHVVAVASVGGITKAMAPGHLAIPDQIIDYTYSRKNTFFDQDLTQVTHIDFTFPYDQDLRLKLLAAAKRAALDVSNCGTYAATQGPRLETAMEIRRLEHDGCDMVGMTGMPEAALARELGIKYASCAVVANWAAGKSDSTINMEEVERNLMVGMEHVRKLLEQLMEIVAR